MSELVAGSVLGRYRLVRPLGAGAMGEVWAADDPELERTVAIKVLHPELVRWSAHLRAEARAMAQLVHPHVVAVHDVGEADGRVYIAMELMAGGSLREWLKVPRPWRAVVEIFVSAARGLAAAHAAGLIHRDFKPDNVLRREDGRVAVGDFGIAKLVGDQREPAGPPSASTAETGGRSDRAALVAALTNAGDLIGTPAYMAPEQHLGRSAGPSSDQFAFCVSLWEAIYGERPFESVLDGEGLSPATCVGLAIVEGRRRPPPPSISTPRWLARALARGLDLDPMQRHPSMAALASTLERGLGAKKRAVTTTFAFAAIGIAVGGGLLARRADSGPSCELAGARVEQAWNADARARVTSAFETSGRQHASTTLPKVLAQLDRYATSLAAVRTGACEATHKTGEQSAATLDRRMICLDERGDELRALVDLLGRGPDGEVVDRAYQAVLRLPSPDDCTAAALASTPLPPPYIRARVDQTRTALAGASALLSAGKVKDAGAAVTPLVATARELGFAPLLAETLAARARILSAQGEPAEQAYQEAALAAATAGNDKQIATALVRQLEVANEEGKAKAGFERVGPAEVAVERAGDPEIREDLLLARGELLISLARYEDARVDILRARTLRANRVGPTDLEVARADSRLATALWHLGRTAEALEIDRQALATYEQHLGKNHPTVGQLLNNLGIRLEASSLYDEARKDLERSLAIKEAALGPGHPSVAMTLNNLAMVAGDQGREADATAYNERALAIREKALGPEHPLVASTLSNLAISRVAANQLDDALALHQRALAIRQKVYGADHPSVATTLNGMAGVFQRLGRLDEALASVSRALEIREKALGADHELVARSLETRGSILEFQNRHAEACADFFRARAVLEKATKPTNPDLTSFLAEEARCLVDTGRAREAVPLATRAVALGETGDPAAVPLAIARFSLARALWDAGDDRARAVALAVAAKQGLSAQIPWIEQANATVTKWLQGHRVR